MYSFIIKARVSKASFMIEHKISYAFATHKYSADTYHRMFQKGEYKKILEVDQRCVNFGEIKANYYRLIKKYHPDKLTGLPKEEKIEHSRICQVLVASYQFVSKQFPNGKSNEAGNSSSSSQYKQESYEKPQPKSRNEMTDDEKAYYDLFGCLFQENPYTYYAEKNKHLKQKYEEYLKKKYGVDKQKEQEEQQRKLKERIEREREMRRQQEQSNSSATTRIDEQGLKDMFPFMIAIASVTGIIALYSYLQMKTHQTTRKESVIMTDEKIEKLKENHKINLENKIDNMLQDFFQERPRMLKYPTSQDPEIDTQVLKYSIMTDIELYEVRGHRFYEQEKNVNLPIQRIQKTRINKINKNTWMTLALEAERCLHNIYVKKADVLKELKENGSYTPPGVFFRFHGYIYFRIRENKPMIIETISRSTGEWISLFDLYFKYYSPIFFKKDEWSEYRVYDNNKQLFVGNVHFNVRGLNPVFLENYKNGRKKKNVFMWKGCMINAKSEQDYMRAWDQYYKTECKQVQDSH